MEQLYLVRDRDGRPVVLAYRHDDDFYEWSPESQLFHAAPELDEDYIAIPSRLSYEPVSLERARLLIQSGIGKTSTSFRRKYRESSRLGDVLTREQAFGEEVFADVGRSERARLFAERLRSSGDGQWDFYASYPKHKAGNAYAAANQIRTGRIRAFAPSGSFDARVERIRDGNYVVHVRLHSEAA